MNMLTHCPACATAFRLTREQLTAHHGQVRCGHCGSVFDAFATLRLNQDAQARLAKPENEKLSGGGVVTSMAPDMAKMPPPSKQFAQTRFEKPSLPKAKWIAVLSWALGILLLTLTGVGQALYFYRVDLVARYPDTKSYLTEYCELLKCEIPLPKQVNLVGIEASDLQADNKRANLMVLAATLRNRAHYPLEYPALELTLTDIENNPVTRRVLRAGDYLSATHDATAGFAANSDVEIKVYIDSSQTRAFGYKLYLFYP